MSRITIKEYQDFTPTTFIVPETPVPADLTYLFSGLVGEAGEVAGNFAKYCREDFDFRELRSRTRKELGDVMYFVTQLCNQMDLELDEVMEANMRKLQARFSAGTIRGDGECNRVQLDIPFGDNI